MGKAFWVIICTGETGVGRFAVHSKSFISKLSIPGKMRPSVDGFIFTFSACSEKSSLCSWWWFQFWRRVNMGKILRQHTNCKKKKSEIVHFVFVDISIVSIIRVNGASPTATAGGSRGPETSKMTKRKNLEFLPSPVQTRSESVFCFFLFFLRT